MIFMQYILYILYMIFIHNNIRSDNIKYVILISKQEKNKNFIKILTLRAI